jgi:tetratricopeptide (TPR) repeat protein
VKNSFINTASESYDKKDFASAAKGFEQVYKMSPQDTIYLYYAASAAVSGKDYETSLKHYETLKNIGYTGVTDQYFATDIESGEEQLFNDKATRDLYVKGKSHNNPRDVKTESKKGEIVKNVALIYIQQGDNDKALEAMADARKADPTDLGLILSEANIYLELGERDKFKALMEEAVEQDPNNPELQYNLGVVTAQAGDNQGAIKYYEKAISLDPEHANSYNNIAAVILGEETEIVDKMNSLGNSAADNRKYEEYKAQRTELYNSAIPYLQKALEVAPNIDTARTLMNIYSVIGETDKFKEMKAKVESMN